MRKTQYITKLTKVKKLIKVMPEQNRAIADELFKELEFMKDTLEKLKRQVLENGVTVGGKEAAALKSYNTTIQRYNLIFKSFTDLLPVLETKKEKDELMAFITQA